LLVLIAVMLISVNELLTFFEEDGRTVWPGPFVRHPSSIHNGGNPWSIPGFPPLTGLGTPELSDSLLQDC
jgi:hypothetical protein